MDKVQKNVQVHLYRTSALNQNDYAFSWYGSLPCYYKEVSENNNHIQIADWTHFKDSLSFFQRDNKISYYPVLFWKIEEDNTQGMIELTKIELQAHWLKPVGSSLKFRNYLK